MKVFTTLAIALVVACTLSLSLGAVSVSPPAIVAILADQIGLSTPWSFTLVEELVVTTVRAPRVLIGVLVGGAMAVAGAALQGLFRNPLADPGLIGVSSGAALAAITVTVLGAPIALALGISLPLLLTFGAFLGGLGTVLIVYRLATRDQNTSVATMLLAGIAVNAVAAAGTGAFVFISDDQQLRDFTFWTLGGLGGATWGGIGAALVFLVPGIVYAPFLAEPLNALALGHAEAQHLGVNVERVKLIVIGLAAITVGAAVAVAGIIGFVGLVTPHLLRVTVGPDHRVVLVGSGLLGAILLVLADLVSRMIVAPAELPVGVVTALIGGPFFLWLLLRERRYGSLEGLA